MPSLPKKTFSKKKTFKVRQPGLYFVVGHVPDLSKVRGRNFLLHVFSDGIHTQFVPKRSVSGRMLAICTRFQSSADQLARFPIKSMVAENGQWAIVGDMSHQEFKATANDLTGLRDQLLADCVPATGALFVMKVVLHNDASVSILWQQQYEDCWNVPDEVDFHEEEFDHQSCLADEAD